MKTETKAVDIDRNKGNFSYDVAHAHDGGKTTGRRRVCAGLDCFFVAESWLSQMDVYVD